MMQGCMLVFTSYVRQKGYVAMNHVVFNYDVIMSLVVPVISDVTAGGPGGDLSDAVQVVHAASPPVRLPLGQGFGGGTRLTSEG